MGTKQQQLEEGIRRLESVLENVEDQLARGVVVEPKREPFALEPLAAGLAHELRNPLSVISATAEYCLGEYAEPELQEHFSIMQRNAMLAEQTIQALLNFARPLDLQMETASLDELVHETCDLVSGRAAEADVSLVVLPSKNSTRVKVDRAQVQQAILHLVLNAVESYPEGKGKVEVKTETRAGRAEVVVLDWGPGISDHDLDKVFEPFFSTRDDQAGLGLPMAQRIAQAHVGEVRLESRSGEGTAARLILPAG